MDPLKPTAAVLCKLGSIIVHAEEYLSAEGHEFDKTAMETLLADEDVKEWLQKMTAMAMLPVKRSKRR